METENEKSLVVVEKSTALDTFSDPKRVAALVLQIKAIASDQAAQIDASTPLGRAAIRALAFKIKRSKTYLDSVGKELVDDLKALPKRIDESRKLAREELDRLHDTVRQPLTDYEAEQAAIAAAEAAKIAAQQQRVQRIVEAIAGFKAAATKVIGHPASAIGEWLTQIEAQAPQSADFDDRHTEAVEAHQRAVEQLKTMHAQAVQIEAQQQAERDRKIAEQATAREREAQEARVVAAKVAAEQAEQRARDAEARAAQQAAEAQAREARQAEESARREEAARQAEIKRQQDEAARIAAEQAARDADIEHKKRVNNQAVADLVQHAGLTDEQAKNVIIAIIRRQISSVSITY